MVTCLYHNVRGRKAQEKRQKIIGGSKVSEIVSISQNVFEILKKAKSSIDPAMGFDFKYPSGTLLKLGPKDTDVDVPIGSSWGGSSGYPYSSGWDDENDMGKNKNWNSGGFYSSSSTTVPKFYIGYTDSGGQEKYDDYVWSSTEKKLLGALKAAGIKPTTFSPKDSSLSYELYTIDKAGWTKEKKTANRGSVLDCAYRATKKYIECMHGGSLANTDESWYKECPLVEHTGLPLSTACTVINKLVGPYNLRISGVRVRKGMSTHKDAPAWMQVLGINPMAIQDHSISNDDFIEAFLDQYRKDNDGKEMPDEQFSELASEVYKQFRFEFHDRPFPGSIVFYSTRVQGSSKSPSYAAGGGHAEFLAPRDKIPAKWQLSIILARKDAVEYETDPPDIPEAEYEYILDPWNCEYKGFKMRSWDESSTEWDKRVAQQKKDGTYVEPPKEKGGKGSKNPPKSQRSTRTKHGSSANSGGGRGSSGSSSATSDSDLPLTIKPHNLEMIPDPKDFPDCPHGFAKCDDNSYRHYDKIPANVKPLTLPKGFEGGAWHCPKDKWMFVAGPPNEKYESQIPDNSVPSDLITEVSKREIELINRASIMEGSTPDEIMKRIQELEADTSYSDDDRKLLITLLQKELAVRSTVIS